MPPSPIPTDSLRQRAATLRTVASKLDTTSALDLFRRAGADVWQGPTPRHCLDDLTSVRTRLLLAAGDLRGRARTLELRATQLDALAAAGPTG